MFDEIINVAAHGVRTVVTFVPKALVDGLADANAVVDSAIYKFTTADDGVCGRLIEAVSKRLPAVLPVHCSLESARDVVINISGSINQGQVRQRLGEFTDASLGLISHAIRTANSVTLLQTAASIVGATVAAFLENVGQLPLIRERVLSNPVNAPTLQLVWGQRAELTTFLVDLVECAKCFVPATGPVTGLVPGPPPLRVTYNELDITVFMNRHAVISQLQRLVKSIVTIVGTTPVFIGPLPEFTMTEQDTRLDTDQFDGPRDGLIRVSLGSKPPWPKEHWLFVNGIGGEYHWLSLACQKLEAKFGKKTVGVFNRGDGIIWDLVECAGERSARQNGSTTSQDLLISRTESSRNAQRLLKENLELMLRPGRAETDAVVVAHSQGCLLLRLVLEDLVNNGGGAMRDRMRQHLRVNTFGNPSINWRVENNPAQELRYFARSTEHFANRTDFVARLGVLGPHNEAVGDDNGYSNVFVNENWKGHLFGAQYSLDANDYTDGHLSWLLTTA